MDDDLKLLDVSIHRFRGFAGQERLPLQFGDVTVLVGANGHGKTTVFDAIDWAVFGDEWRWAGADTDVTRGLRRPDEVPAVTIRFRGNAGHTLVRNGRRATWDGAPFDPGSLCRNLEVFARSAELVRALRGVTYLPQENLRALVASDARTDRHSFLATLAGIPFADRFERNLRNTLGDLELRKRSADKDLNQITTRKAELVQQLQVLRDLGNSHAEILANVSAFVGQSSIDLSSAEPAVTRRILELKQSEQSSNSRAVASSELARDLEQATVTDGALRVAVNEALKTRDVTAQRLTLALQTERNQLEEQAEALQALQRLGSAAEESRATLESAERHRAHQRSVLSADAAVAASSARLEALRSIIARQQNALIEARLASEAAEDRLKVVRRQVARATDRKAMTVRKAELVKQLASLRSLQGETEAVHAKSIQGATATQGRERLSKERVDELRGLLMQSLDGAERVAKIIGELLALQAGDDPKCLVCGHDHVDGETRVDAMRGQLERAATTRELFNALGAASIQLTNSAKEARLAERSVQDTLDLLSKLSQDRTQVLAEIETLDLRSADLEEDATPLERRVSELSVSTQLAADAAAALEVAEQSLATTTATVAREAEAQRHAEEDLEALLGTAPPAPDSFELDDEAIKALRQAADHATTALRLARSTAEAKANLQATQSLEVTRTRQELAKVEGALQAETTKMDAMARHQAGLRERAQDLGVEVVFDEKSVGLLKDLAARFGEDMRHSRDARVTGEALQSSLATLKAVSQIQASETELADLLAAESRAAIRLQRVQVGQARLDEIAAVVRKAIAESAASAIKSAEDRVNEVLSDLCPHQHLNVMRLAQDGILRATDEGSSYRVKPEFYGSTGQLGCMGLAVFLGIALGQRWSRLRVLMLDEPVQNMDDVNFVRFLDLIRRLTETHQVVVSTADKNIGELLRRKLLLWADGRTKRALFHWFDAFDVERGPTIRTEELSRLRAVAG